MNKKDRSVEDKSQTVDRLDENRICLQFFMYNLKICLSPRRSDIFGKNVRKNHERSTSPNKQKVSE
ncbi:hypothetical protein AM232_04675 [Bacillus sp. FJAT-21352]|nr:hypothetical protein DOZ91_09770 [Peribacillus frigoritolerans]KOR77848.1 hypothetical protein AM232_04675 [Bacillus sp. FJAT-21352]